MSVTVTNISDAASLPFSQWTQKYDTLDSLRYTKNAAAASALETDAADAAGDWLTYVQTHYVNQNSKVALRFGLETALRTAIDLVLAKKMTDNMKAIADDQQALADRQVSMAEQLHDRYKTKFAPCEDATAQTVCSTWNGGRYRPDYQLDPLAAALKKVKEQANARLKRELKQYCTGTSDEVADRMLGASVTSGIVRVLNNSMRAEEKIASAKDTTDFNRTLRVFNVGNHLSGNATSVIEMGDKLAQNAIVQRGMAVNGWWGAVSSGADRVLSQGASFATMGGLFNPLVSGFAPDYTPTTDLSFPADSFPADSAGDFYP